MRADRGAGGFATAGLTGAPEPLVQLLPAIDLLGGRCVRLRQGAYDEQTIYSDDPVAVAHRFVEEGARWIHIVDLDAAKSGQPVNRRLITAVAEAVRPAGVSVEASGGVRSVDTAQVLWGAGVARVVVGTVAVENPSLVDEFVAAGARDGGAVAVGLDHRAGEVAVRGWTEASGVALTDVLPRVVQSGVEAVIVTDIRRDGMLGGPDIEVMESVLRTVGGPAAVGVIASGGVASAADIERLAALSVEGRRLAGVIVGRALYEGRLTVKEGLAACAASV
jgi:phosphoribosylformimino-5-aminoimidazole carboxamide ribotide isomerase